MDIIHLSRELMRSQTQKNGAPAWSLTELAVRKGRELSKAYGVDEELVVTSLYLAHTVFSPIWKGDVQKNHPALSEEFIKPYLREWSVSVANQEIILNAVKAHHNAVSTTSKIAEVVKNAECFKFVTVEGSLILLHELGRRNVSFEESVEKVIEKMEQKKVLLTLPQCIEEAEKNCVEITRLFNLDF